MRFITQCKRSRAVQRTSAGRLAGPAWHARHAWHLWSVRRIRATRAGGPGRAIHAWSTVMSLHSPPRAMLTRRGCNALVLLARSRRTRGTFGAQGTLHAVQMHACAVTHKEYSPDVHSAYPYARGIGVLRHPTHSSRRTRLRMVTTRPSLPRLSPDTPSRCPLVSTHIQRPWNAMIFP